MIRLAFVRVLDDTTLAIPDRPANHQADAFVNVVQHPYIGLIFLIPGSKNTLRVRGKATIVSQPRAPRVDGDQGKSPRSSRSSSNWTPLTSTARSASSDLRDGGIILAQAAFQLIVRVV